MNSNCSFTLGHKRFRLTAAACGRLGARKVCLGHADLEGRPANAKTYGHKEQRPKVALNPVESITSLVDQVGARASERWLIVIVVGRRALLRKRRVQADDDNDDHNGDNDAKHNFEDALCLLLLNDLLRRKVYGALGRRGRGRRLGRLGRRGRLGRLGRRLCLFHPLRWGRRKEAASSEQCVDIAFIFDELNSGHRLWRFWLGRFGMRNGRLGFGNDVGTRNVGPRYAHLEEHTTNTNRNGHDDHGPPVRL